MSARIPRPLRNAAQRLAAALSGGLLGGALAAATAYLVCRVLVERGTGLDAAFWPGLPWLGECALYGALGGLLLVPGLLRRSATLKGLAFSLLPGLGMAAGLLPVLPADPAPFAGSDLALPASASANAVWGLAACWWMKLCGRT